MKKFVLALVLCTLIVFSIHGAIAEDGFMTHQLIEIEFSYGARSGYYTGSTIDGLPSGYGLFETQNSAGQKWFYMGEFKDGTFNGSGSSYWVFDSDHENGTYENGNLVCGQKYNAVTTAMYDGEFARDGTTTLKGKVYNSEKELVFEGDVKNGLFMTGTLYNTSDGSIAAKGEFGEGFYNFVKREFISGYTY